MRYVYVCLYMGIYECVVFVCLYGPLKSRLDLFTLLAVITIQLELNSIDTYRFNTITLTNQN